MVIIASNDIEGITMTLKNIVSNFIANFSPLSLVKPILPAHDTTKSYAAIDQSNKPWVNVDAIELTQEDFAMDSD
jgi:hypothetical protein